MPFLLKKSLNDFENLHGVSANASSARLSIIQFLKSKTTTTLLFLREYSKGHSETSSINSLIANQF